MDSPEIKTVVDQLRSTFPNVLLATTEIRLAARAVVEIKGKYLIPQMNQLGVSAMTGHRDFAYGA